MHSVIYTHLLYRARQGIQGRNLAIHWIARGQKSLLGTGGRYLAWGFIGFGLSLLVAVPVLHVMMSGAGQDSLWAALMVIMGAVILLTASSMLLGYRLGVRNSAAGEDDRMAGLIPKEALRSLIARHLGASGTEPVRGVLIHCELTGAPALAATHGLQAQEHIIREASARLSDLVPQGAVSARAGHGSFLIFLPFVSDPVEAMGHARAITSSLAAGLHFDGVKLSCACHSGISLAPKDGTTAEELLQAAEIALAAAREQEAPGYGFYDQLAAASATRRRDVQRAVATAHAAGTFRLAYQPIHHMRSGELAGFEALLRLDDADLGTIAPSEFIPAAEQAGLISEIGETVLEEACRTARHWPPQLVVAVNLSPAQFLTGTLIGAVRAALERNALPAYRLEVEITEGTLMKDSELVLRQLRVLRDMGVGVALDDFGTGYSSLGYLWKFPFSKLKIDRSFVAGLAESASTKGILRSIVKLGHGLGMAVTAEGIETADQLAALRELGCDLAQGHFLARPASATDIAPIILRSIAAEGRKLQRQPTRAAARRR